MSSKPIEAMEFYLRMILSGAEFLCVPFSFQILSKICGEPAMKGNRSMDIFWSLDLAPMPLDLKWIMHVYKSLLRDAVSFTALISGYVSRGSIDDARFLFDYLWETWCLGTPWFRATLKVACLKRHWLCLWRCWKQIPRTMRVLWLRCFLLALNRNLSNRANGLRLWLRIMDLVQIFTSSVHLIICTQSVGHST